MSHPFIDPISASAQNRLNSVCAEPVLMRVACDLDERLAFDRRWLIVTSERVLVTSRDCAEKFADVSLSDVERARFEGVVGGGRIIVERNGDPPFHLYCSNSATARFIEVAKGIQDLSAREPLRLPSRLETTRCPQCRRLLPEVDGNCPRCVRKFAVLRRMLSYLRPHRGLAVLLLLATAVGTAAELLPPLIIRSIVDDVLTPRAGWEMLGWFALTLLGVRLVVWAAEAGRGWLGVLLGGGITARIRSQVYHRFQSVSLRHFDERPVGSMMARITSDVERLEEFLVSAVPLLFMNLLMLIGILIFLFGTSWKLTLYVLAPVPIVAIAAWTSWGPVKRAWGRQAERWAWLSDRVSQSLAGIREVRAFGQERREIEAFDRRNDEVARMSVLGERLSFAFFTVLYFLMSLGQILVWYFGGREVLAGQLTLGTLLAVIAYLWMLYWPLQWLGSVHQSMVQALTGAERIFEVLDTPLESDGADAGVPLRSVRGEVRFEGVTFGYDPARPVLHDIAFEVRPGERVAIVGRSGAGKTTLINLLCRFYEPDAGRILLDGVNVADVRVADLREQMAIVAQEPFLFSGTIAENIRYGRPDAGFDDVMEAARAANAHNFILDKDDGYDTEVGERGDRLSGGERQRVAIARALLRDPRILILDEATSSVDSHSERLIREAIERLSADRTTFVIAHRISTIRNAGKFLVIDDGRLVESGTYDELMQQHSTFFDLVNSREDDQRVHNGEPASTVEA